MRLHREPSDVWVDRCRSQIFHALAALEADRAGRTGDYWFGGSTGHADIAVAAALRHLTESLPGLVSMADFPALSAHAAQLEALPVVQAIS